MQLSALVTPSSANARRRAIVIGVDGLDGDEMHTASIPTLDLLEQVWTRSARTQLTGATYSGPGWTSILTGVEVEDHGVTYNGGYDERNPGYPTVLLKLRDAGLETASLHSVDRYL